MRAELAPQSFSYIPPGQPHRLNWRGDGELLNLYISDQRLQELTEQCGPPIPGFKIADHSDRAVYEIGRLLVDEFHSVGGLAPAMIDHAICLISRRLLRAGERISRGEYSGLLSLSRLQPAIDTIYGNLERDFTLIELARLCNSSVFHFARSFSARTGSAPFRLQRTLRLQKAQQLLLEPGLSVGEVAIAVGFESLPHFSRVFSKADTFNDGMVEPADCSRRVTCSSTPRATFSYNRCRVEFEQSGWRRSSSSAPSDS